MLNKIYAAVATLGSILAAFVYFFYKGKSSAKQEIKQEEAVAEAELRREVYELEKELSNSKWDAIDERLQSYYRDR